MQTEDGLATGEPIGPVAYVQFGVWWQVAKLMPRARMLSWNDNNVAGPNLGRNRRDVLTFCFSAAPPDYLVVRSGHPLSIAISGPLTPFHVGALVLCVFSG